MTDWSLRTELYSTHEKGRKRAVSEESGDRRPRNAGRPTDCKYDRLLIVEWGEKRE
jgi:hypothetical protein